MASELGAQQDYSRFVYDLLSGRATVSSHTVAVYSIGQTVGMVRGEIRFRSGHILRVFEQIDFLAQRIVKYSYEVYDPDNAQLWWYDPMPHPHIPELQSTHPHHKHVPPEIKHNRIPAPGIAFYRPNLPYLIAEVEALDTGNEGSVAST